MPERPPFTAVWQRETLRAAFVQDLRQAVEPDPWDRSGKLRWRYDMPAFTWGELKQLARDTGGRTLSDAAVAALLEVKRVFPGCEVIDGPEDDRQRAAMQARSEADLEGDRAEIQDRTVASSRGRRGRVA